MAAGYSISISAADGATAVIDRINKRLSGLVAPAQKFGQSVSKLGDVSGISKLSEGMQSLGGRSLDAFRSMDHIVPTLAAITGALSIAGMAAMIQQWASFGQEVANTGQRLGIPTDRLTQLTTAAKLAGATSGDMTAGLGALDEKLRGATFRGDSVAIQTFRAIGVSFGQIGVKARTAGEAFEDVRAGIRKIYVEQGRGAALRAAQNLGIEGLFPMLVKSRAEIAALEADSKRLGGLISPEAAARAEQLNNAFNRVGVAATGFANAISDSLSPVITPLLNQMADLIAYNRVWIAQDLGGFARRIAAWVKTIGWTNVVQGVKDLWEWITKITKDWNWKSVTDSVTDVSDGFGKAVTGVKWLKDEFVILRDMLDGWKVPEWLNWLNTISSNAGKSLHDWLTGTTTATTPANPDGSPGTASGKDERTWYERLYRPGPGLLPGQQGTGTRGERNHNPLNLSANNQPGMIGSDGRFGIYANDETGIAAEMRQIVMNQDRKGDRTVAQLIERWAPKKDGNDTASYSAQVAQRIGVGVNDNVDVHDPEVARKMVAAMARRETGREYDPAVVQRGVFAGLGRTAPLAAGGGGDGKVAVTVAIQGAPPGTRVTAKSEGIAHMPSPAKVATALPMFGWP